jgi:DNA-binding NtrC family response regulator
MGTALQGKLLRVLQDREVRPVGGTQSAKVDVRIVAATNKELEPAIEAGSFREDLFYRLAVIPIHIPPLRERPEDIPALVDAFVRRHSEGTRRVVSPAAMEHLMSRPWKGNARELENVVERALALSEAQEITPEDLPVHPTGSSIDNGSPRDALRSATNRRLTLRELEDRYIEEILRLSGGNKVQAAKILGIDRKTLYRRAERSAQQANATPPVGRA